MCMRQKKFFFDKWKNKNRTLFFGIKITNLKFFVRFFTFSKLTAERVFVTIIRSFWPDRTEGDCQWGRSTNR